MDTNKANQEFDSTNILLFFIRWWKHLAIICATAVVFSVVFSSPFFITPLYESTVLMFPAKSNSLTKSVLNINLDFMEYGDVDDAERLLQVLGSSAIRDRMVKRFDLFNHYEISEKSRYRNTILRNKYNSKVSARRTPYGAVEVKVRDKDPQLAADMANEIVAVSDTIQNDLRRERASMVYQMALERYNSIISEITLAEDSLRNIMFGGVYDHYAQSERLTQQLAIDISRNNKSGIRALEEQLAPLKEFGGPFLTQRVHLDQVGRTLSPMQRFLQEAQVDLEYFVPFKFLIDEAYPAEKKSYPVRWLIVFLSTFAAGVLGTLTLMMYETLVNRGVIKVKEQK